ncbi:hypothetical protein [Anabaena sp. CCY 9910]|uniref:hypothetical protein n=1 Tax=Anabaena sp. CCY 9910 TaxID=3103870 RepID=UPI0039E1498F
MKRLLILLAIAALLYGKWELGTGDWGLVYTAFSNANLKSSLYCATPKIKVRAIAKMVKDRTSAVLLIFWLFCQ